MYLDENEKEPDDVVHNYDVVFFNLRFKKEKWQGFE